MINHPSGGRRNLAVGISGYTQANLDVIPRNKLLPLSPSGNNGVVHPLSIERLAWVIKIDRITEEMLNVAVFIQINGFYGTLQKRKPRSRFFIDLVDRNARRIGCDWVDTKLSLDD